VDLIAILVLVLPEICWYIYGNTIVYSGEMHSCEGEDDGRVFFISVMVLIVYGYIYMTVFLFVFVFASFAYCYYNSYVDELNSNQQTESVLTHRQNVRNNQKMISEMPYISEISKYQARKFRSNFKNS
jgi:hypothetical protein